MKNTYFGDLCVMHTIAYILVIIGALNWGLVAFGWFIETNLNLVNVILGNYPYIEYSVYLVVGLSAIVMLFQGTCDYCSEEV